MQTPQKISLVTQTADILRDHIATGKILHSLPGENKLAADLQISRKTLRAALQILTAEKVVAPPKVGARRKILKNPDQQTSRRKSLGILLPRPLAELHASSQSLFRALRKRMDSRKVDLHFHDFPYLAPRQSTQQVEEILTSHHADLWLILEITPALTDLVNKLGTPTIASGGLATPTIPNICYDANSAILHAHHKLINAGHTRICHPLAHKSGPRTAVLELFEKQGIPRSEALHSPDFNNTTTDLICMLERLFKLEDQAPTAFITEGPRSLITLITWLCKHKLSVPEDVSILHIGSDPMIEAVIPQISYYSTSFSPLARELDRVIGALLQSGQFNSENKKLFMNYIPGASLAPPSR